MRVAVSRLTNAPGNACPAVKRLGAKSWDGAARGEPARRARNNQPYDDDFRGMPNPPSNAASGCFEDGFCGADPAASASSTLRTEAGDGS